MGLATVRTKHVTVVIVNAPDYAAVMHLLVHKKDTTWTLSHCQVGVEGVGPSFCPYQRQVITVIRHSIVLLPYLDLNQK
jgi:hypothetical protein